MTDLNYSFLQLNRLRIMSRGRSVYDEKFHSGVNIIRGDNSAGKSTIADFIFFVLGGDFKEWKPATSRCDEVYAEISTPRGTLSLRREKTEGRPPIWIYFDSLEVAAKHGIDNWEVYPIQRVQNNLSFTEVLFKSMLLPEAQSDGASNITNHQLMRLLYSDQRTPAPRLFRFERFDKSTIRTAVGDLICGIRSFGLFEAELLVRELEAKYTTIDTKWKALFNTFTDQIGVSVNTINEEIKSLEVQKTNTENEIQDVDNNVSSDQNNDFYVLRKSMVEQLSKLRLKLTSTYQKIENSKLEQNEIIRFIEHLSKSLSILDSAEKTSKHLGEIDFSHCPSCLNSLPDTLPENSCGLCGQELSAEQNESRYNSIRIDLELQTKESKQLLNQEIESHADHKKYYTRLQREFEQLTSNFALKFELSNSPREAFLAERHSKLGSLNKEIQNLRGSLQRAEELDILSSEKEKCNTLLTEAKLKRAALSKNADNRRRTALSQVSKKAAHIIRSDKTGAQEEFEAAQNVDISFEDDAVLVDGLANFSESSNVFLKNAAILGLHLAACNDEKFFHPRFALFDNIEDKGMQPQRSHCFQELIVKLTTETPISNQVIFTTSLMNPDLELDDYVIGPYYTEKNKTLDFGKSPEKVI